MNGESSRNPRAAPRSVKARVFLRRESTTHGRDVRSVKILRSRSYRDRSCNRSEPYEFPMARFSNLVNSRMNASLTVPVGPLRCLPMISSATPCASGGGWLLSAY